MTLVLIQVCFFCPPGSWLPWEVSPAFAGPSVYSCYNGALRGQLCDSDWLLRCLGHEARFLALLLPLRSLPYIPKLWEPAWLTELMMKPTGGGKVHPPSDETTVITLHSGRETEAHWVRSEAQDAPSKFGKPRRGAPWWVSHLCLSWKKSSC